MKILWDYFRRHIGSVFTLFICTAIFLLIFYLYDFPTEAVLYGFVLSFAFCLLPFVLSCLL